MRSGLTGLVLAGVLVAAGCGGSVSGSPEPTEGVETGEHGGAGLPHSGAPAVEDPIDVEPFLEQPCTLIDAELLEEAGFDVRETKPDPDAAAGPSCQWRPSVFEHGTFAGALLTGDGYQGLSSLYAQRDELEFFEELEPIDGYSVVASARGDGREEGRCRVSVGMRDDVVYAQTVIAIDEQSPRHDDPCEAAHELAGLAVETMSERAE